MSKPFFLTGANAKIIVNNVTLAFATDISYKIDIRHATPRVLGMYEAQEVQPLSYAVSGSFTIIRYAKGLKTLINGGNKNTVLGNNLLGAAIAGVVQAIEPGFNNNTSTPGPGGGAPPNVSDRGNSIGSWAGEQGGIINKSIGNPFGGTAADARTDQSLDPGKLNKSLMFDIEIRQQAGGGLDGGMARIRNCRITSAEFNMSKRSLGTQTFTFEAMYADEDSFIASLSGIGQHLE